MNSNISFSIGDHWITLVVDLVVVSYLMYALLYRKNWRFIGIRRVGVLFRLGKEVMDETSEDGIPKALIIGPGIYHLNYPIDRIKVVAMFDMRIRIKILVPTAAPNPQNFEVLVVYIVKCLDALKAVLAVPDGNPMGEFASALEGSAYSGVQAFSAEQLLAVGGKDKLEREIFAKITANPLTERWGLSVPQVIVRDVNPSKEYMSAVGQTLQATYAAQAYHTLKAEQGPDFVALAAISALQKSKITTLVGLGEQLKKLFEGAGS